MVKRFFLAVILTAFSVISFAQEVKEVTLVVNGDGATKEEATHVALRSAIEQAFGTFVSANTTILNDELVKDEIATVSSGNIQSYTELSSYTLSNGNTSITLQATVSIGKLVTYAKSKGSECEFAGATFGANIKMLKLKYENSKKAFANLVQYIKEVGPSVFDKKISISEPQIFNKKAQLDLEISFETNTNTLVFYDHVMATIQAIALKKNEIELLSIESETQPFLMQHDGPLTGVDETMSILIGCGCAKYGTDVYIPLCCRNPWRDEYSKDGYRYKEIGVVGCFERLLFDYCIAPSISTNLGNIKIGEAVQSKGSWGWGICARMLDYYSKHAGKSKVRKKYYDLPLPSMKFIYITYADNLSQITGFFVK